MRALRAIETESKSNAALAAALVGIQEAIADRIAEGVTKKFFG